MKLNPLEKQMLLFAFACIAMHVAKAQYRGGASDGSAANRNFNQNILPNIYRGGIADGTNASIVLSKNELTNIYKGGIADGYGSAYMTAQNFMNNIYAGGNSDGSALALSKGVGNLLNNIYQGGNADGFSTIIVRNENVAFNIYSGGTGDGFTGSNILVAANPLNNIYQGGNADGFATIVVYNQNVLPGIATVAFTGKWQEENIVLNWQVTNEQSLTSYQLERSVGDAAHFETIHAENVSSSTLKNNGYKHLDENTHTASVFYYRLKSIDKAGKISYSAIVRLTKEKKNITYTIYPNPGSGLFNISITGELNFSNYTYNILDANGKLVRQEKISSNKTRFDISRLAAGSYYVQIFNNKQLQNTYKIILQH